MSQYDVLDAFILDAVARGSSKLYTGYVSHEAERIARATGREAMRVIDGRIQALRKAGRISFASGIWQFNAAEAKP